MALAGCECDDPSGITALQGELEVRDGRVAPSEQVEVHSIDVGEVPLGVPLRIPLVAANPGTADLLVCADDAFDACGMPSGVEPASSPFSVELENADEEGWAVPPSGEREFGLRFRPAEEGEVTATLVLRHDGGNGPETRIELRGVGVAPDVAINPATLDFGPVTVGRRRTLTLELENRTQFAQPVSIPALDQTTVVFGVIDDAGQQVPTGEALESTVPGDGRLALTVFFQPAEEQAYTDQLSI
jgi:hypothetical protein